MRIFILLAVVTVGMLVALLGYRAARSQSPPVAQVGNSQLDPTGVSDMQTVTARVRALTHNPQFLLDANTWVKHQILYQEAQRRGLTCTAADAEQRLLSTYQQTLHDGHPETMLIAAEASGMAPEGYSQTPEAQRVPNTAAVVDKFLHDPNVISTQQVVCSIARLGRQVNTMKVDGFATIEAQATVVVSATDTPTPPSPAATP